MTNLLKAISVSRSSIEITAGFYASTGALGRLRLAYTDKQFEEILLIEKTLINLYNGGLIQSDEKKNLEKFRKQILAIAQSDSRLKYLFK
ncbi:hypothetical protein H6F75_15290 [Nodosilinea sp. FACHB-131]|nr:hypothetical protein [Nodosilinea sp. FACHB-131]